MSSKEEDMRQLELCSKLDRYLSEITTSHINKKLELGQNLITFLTENPEALNNYHDAAQFIESLASNWIVASNSKVSGLGLQALTLIAEGMKAKYKTYAGPAFHHALQKLGDSKDSCRTLAVNYLVKCMDVGAYAPNSVMEKLIPLLTSKNANLASVAQNMIIEMLAHENRKVTADVLKDLVAAEIKCLNTPVLKESVNNIIIAVTNRIGKPKVLEILNAEMLTAVGHNASKIQAIIDSVRAVVCAGTPAEEDDTDTCCLKYMDTHIEKAPVKRFMGTAVKPKQQPTRPAAFSGERAGAGAAPKATAASSSKTPAAQGKSGTLRPTKIGEGDKYALHSGDTGELPSYQGFLKAFEDTPEIHCANRREFDTLAKKICEDLATPKDSWEVKMLALKRLRAVVLHLIPPYDDLVIKLVKDVGFTLVTIMKESRSQIIREVCMSFSFLCVQLKNKVDSHTCEIVMNQLFTNIQNSTAVLSRAGSVAIEFMLRNVTHGRLIYHINSQLDQSRSRDVKVACCEFLELVLTVWPLNKLEHQLAYLQEAIRRGVSEPSADARVAARRAFRLFQSHFPHHGEALLQNMDAIIRKQILAESERLTKSAEPTSTTTSAAMSAPATVTRVKQPLSSRAQPTPRDTRRMAGTVSARSNSAIDLNAARRAKVTQEYKLATRFKGGGHNHLVQGASSSLPRPKKIGPPPSGPPSSTFIPANVAERTGRTRNRVAGVSQSQPGSRSGSPSSRLGYHTYMEPSLTYVNSRNIPRSQGTSRETSPNRFGGSNKSLSSLGQKRRLGIGVGASTSSRPVMAQKMLAQSLEAENQSFPDHGRLYDGDTTDSLGHKVSPRKSSYRPFEDHSDDSDASSLCSERSFDSYRRTSDNIRDIIAGCESNHWSERKEGLVGLQHYLQNNNLLEADELKKITELFTRMFNDSHTKVFSLFLDTLNELIVCHRSDLNFWLYVLLTRLLNKYGTDLLGSIQSKILRTLDVVRDSFPPENQMSSLIRFLTDPTQTPTLRTKTAALNYICKLTRITDPTQIFPAEASLRDPVTQAIAKMIGWTMGDSIKQGKELRQASQECINALFTLNVSGVTMRISMLHKEYQQAASLLLNTKRRSSSSSGSGAANSPPSPSPIKEFPSNPRHFAALQSAAESTPHAISPEEVYRNLRKTTFEIQNYLHDFGSDKPPDKDNTTSKDSGISQLSGTEALEEAMEELSLQSSSSSNATTNTLTNRVLMVRDCNMDTGDNGHPEEGGVDEHEAMRKIVDALKSPPDSDNGENVSIISENEKRATLGQLTRLIRDSSVGVLEENFKSLLRILLGNLALDVQTRDVQTRILVLTALTELIKKRALTEYFNHYVELLILKVLNSYKDTSKEVVRNAEACANTIATTLSPGMVIRVLAPLIQTGDYPLNLAAIKMLTKLIDACGRDPVFDYLADLMPGLIQAYDNPESSVRKSAVLCMVSLHHAIGEEELQPHLAALNGSKMKLLQLYIKRSLQGSSAPTSPRNHPDPSS